MKKLIKINGELDEKGSTANKLSILAAKDGKDLTTYISDLFDNHVKKNNKKEGE